jgi:hypothetical protein
MLITHPNRRRDLGEGDQFTHTQSSQHKSSVPMIRPNPPPHSGLFVRPKDRNCPGSSPGRSTCSAQSKGWVDVSRITPSEAQGWCITLVRPRKYQENGFGHCYQKEANWPLRRGFVSGAEEI